MSAYKKMQAMVRRQGRKDPGVYFPFFPQRITAFIDLFMGSGRMTFAMADRCQHVFSNDLDDDIFNLYHVISTQKDDLLHALECLPVHMSLFNYWKVHEEEDPVKKALRFLMLSNFSLYGSGDALKIETSNSKQRTIEEIQRCFFSSNIKFLHSDFRDVFSKMHSSIWTHDAFVYADPPYFGTGDNYQHSFTEEDSADLFTVLVDSGLRFAMSEFEHPFICEQAAQHGLSIVPVCERRTVKSRNTEILIMNYDHTGGQMPLFSS